MRCQSKTPKEFTGCTGEGTVPVKYLTGERMLCPACAKHCQIVAEMLEPVDRKIIEDLKRFTEEANNG